MPAYPESVISFMPSSHSAVLRSARWESFVNSARDPANRPRHGYKLLVPEPDIDGLDLSRLTDDELNDLDARVDAEIDARTAATPAPPRRPRRPRSPRVSGSGTK